MLCKPVDTYTTSSWKKTTFSRRQIILSLKQNLICEGKLFACEHVCNLNFLNGSSFGQLQATEGALVDASLIRALVQAT